MKRNSSHWLQEVGTREGNRVVYKRAYIPSHLTDIRETFARVQNELDEEWFENWKTNAALTYNNQA
jgi:hypothetical protein